MSIWKDIQIKDITVDKECMHLDVYVGYDGYSNNYITIQIKDILELLKKDGMI